MTQFSSVQPLSHVRLFATPWAAAYCASPSITNSRSLLKHMSTSVSDAIQPSHPLSSPSPPTFNLSQHRGLFKFLTAFIQIPLPHPRPTVHCLDHCSFTLSLKVCSISPSTSFFFNIVLAILGLLPFHMNFRISLLISTK